MTYFDELAKNPQIKAYFDSLVGITIDEACKKLGRWWMCVSCHINAFDGKGWYKFHRAAGGNIELRTEFRDGKNIVVGEEHNACSMVFVKRDLGINKND